MEIIKDKIVFSNDIERIFSGINAFDFKYDYKPSRRVIENVRLDFYDEVNKIFNGKVAIIKEDEMLLVNNLITGDYPHRYIRQNICYT